MTASAPDPSPPWAGARTGGGWRFALLSLVLHAAAAGLLWRLGPWPIAVGSASTAARPMTVDDARRLREARVEARTREVEALAKTAGARPASPSAESKAGSGSEPADDRREGTPLQRLQRATEALEARDRAERAEELSRLLRIPLDRAQARVAAERPAPPPTARDEAAAIAQWEQRAQDAAQRVAMRAERHADGQRVDAGPQAQPGTAPGGPPGGAPERMAGNSGGPPGSRPGQSRSGGGGAGDSTGSGPSGSGGGTGGGAPPLEGPSGFSDPRRYAPDAKVAAAAQARSSIERARRIGAAGPSTQRVVLDRWYVAGPFATRGPGDLARRVYPPELAVDLDAVYEGKGGRLLRWQWSDQPGYPFVPQPRREDAIYFAYTEVVVEQAQDVWLDLGVDDDARLWLNDVPVWTSGPESKPWYRQPYYTLQRDIANRSLVEASVRVRLRAGRNRLLLKLYNGIDLMFFSVVIRA